jgi:3-mercaptopyruvate sulfurtransferase SseA
MHSDRSARSCSTETRTLARMILRELEETLRDEVPRPVSHVPLLRRVLGPEGMHDDNTIVWCRASAVARALRELLVMATAGTDEG